jgi:hypothetical protein
MRSTLEQELSSVRDGREVEREGCGYHSTKRPCDDPHLIFERNRGKWTEPPQHIPRKSTVAISSHHSDAQLKASGGSNPNNWHKCEKEGCEVPVWKNSKLCKKHRDQSRQLTNIPQ